MSPKPEIVVVSALKDWTCVECGSGGGLLTMEERGLVSRLRRSRSPGLPARRRRRPDQAAAEGEWPLGRRRPLQQGAKALRAQGILVEEPALEQAEAECLADADVRARRREREGLRRAEQDLDFQVAMAAEILRLFPGCPRERAEGSPATREPAAAAGWGGAPRGGRSIQARSPLPSPPRSATGTRRTTSC